MLKMTGLELAVAKISRVRGPRWLLWRLTHALRPLVTLITIETNRVMLRRAEGVVEIEWCARVQAALQGFLATIDDLARDGNAGLKPGALPRKITHRARKRAATLFALVLLIYTVHGISMQAQDWSTVHVDDSLVRLIIVSPEDQSTAICTGVIVNEHEGYVAAAAHCVPTSTSASIAAEKKHAERIVVNYALDVAVLKVKGLKGHAAHLRLAAAHVGLPITCAGYGFGALRLKRTFGWLSDPEDESLLAAHLLVDSDVIAGMSGGGMFDQDGQLVTIVAGALVSRTVGRLAYGPTPEVLADFLKPYLKEKP